MGEMALQLPLLTSAEMPAGIFAEVEARGVYTGARLRAQRPEVYERCLALLNEGVSPLQIESVLKIDHRTVAAVAAAHSIPIQTAKKRMAERFRFAADRLLDLVHLAVDAREAKDFMIGASCATDKWQLLDGQPTSRAVDIEVTVTGADWNAWIDCAAEKNAANGRLRLEGEETLNRPAIDSPSTDALSQHTDGQCHTVPLDSAATEPATEQPDTLDRGGGGLAANLPRPLHSDVSAPENFPAKGIDGKGLCSTLSGCP
jgi:hypothetical protein